MIYGTTIESQLYTFGKKEEGFELRKVETKESKEYRLMICGLKGRHCIDFTRRTRQEGLY